MARMCCYNGEMFAGSPTLGRPAREDALWRRRFAHGTPTIVLRNAYFQTISSITWLRWLESDDVRDGLRAVHYLGHFVSAHEERLVRLARDGGCPWHDIAWYLGVSRQAVHQRWAKRLREAEPPAASD